MRTLQERRELVVRHGRDPIAYSTLQPGLRYFDTSFGYVAYHPAFGTQLTLGPPVCSDSDLTELASRFQRQFPRASWFYVPQSVARLAQELGDRSLASASIGVDRVVPLTGLELDSTPAVRGALRKAARSDLEVEFLSAEAVTPAVRDRVRALNLEYLETHPPGRELRFLNRPFELDLDSDGLSRRYLIRWTERGVHDVRGFARLNPFFESGKVSGYLLDVFRFGRTRLWGVFLSSVVKLAEDLRAQGISRLSLGFCPLHAAGSGSASLLERQVSWFARHLAAVPYVERLRSNKVAFPGEDVPRYLASRGSAARAFLALLSASHVPWRSLAMKSVLSSVSRPYASRLERSR